VLRACRQLRGYSGPVARAHEEEEEEVVVAAAADASWWCFFLLQEERESKTRGRDRRKKKRPGKTTRYSIADTRSDVSCTPTAQKRNNKPNQMLSRLSLSRCFSSLFFFQSKEQCHLSETVESEIVG
jgi:hypothetical protein